MAQAISVMPVEIIKQSEHGYFLLFLRQDNIIHVNVKAGVEIDIEQIKEIIEALGIIGNRKKYPILITVDDYTFPTPEARKYLAKDDTNPYTLASAFVVKSLAQKLVTNAYLKINSPKRPTKIFTSIEDANKWLRTYL